MKLGYFTLTDNPPAYGRRRSANQILKELVDECILAEELGFDSVWIPEHHFSLFGTCPSPAVFLSHIAARTKRVRLAPATVVSPLNHPVRLAEEFALLDLLSDGRAVFSAGRGYDEREYDAFQVSFAESPGLLREGLDVIRRAWTEEEFSYDGRYYKVPFPVRVEPRPVQRPHPPIYVACFSRPTLEMAADSGYHAVFAPFAATMMFGSVQAAADAFRARARAAGHPGSRVMCSYFFSIADTAEEQLRTKKRLLKYFHGVLPAFPSDPDKTPHHIRYFVDIVQRLSAMKPEDLGERSIITGDARYCVEILKKCEAAGLEEVILYFNFGELDHEDTVKQMKRFAEEVLPYFR